ncbi:MAG: VOC family protein [Mycobacteriales bacterium]
MHSLPRLRQVVIAAEDPWVVVRLRSRFGLSEAYRDPGVARFGVQNWVCQLGNDFVEVISPISPQAPAARYLRRARVCFAGYMVMFEVASLTNTRKVIGRRGWRVVWSLTLPDITDVHLHPADLPGAIVAVDECRPPGSWRWGGPARQPHGSAGVAAVSLSVPDPEQAARRWAELLAVPLATARSIDLEAQRIEFVEGGLGLHRVALRVDEGCSPSTLTLDQLQLTSTPIPQSPQGGNDG